MRNIMQLLNSKCLNEIQGGASHFAIPGANWATLFALSTKAVVDSLGASLLAEWYGKEPVPAYVKAASSGASAAIGLYVGFSSYKHLARYLPV